MWAIYGEGVIKLTILQNKPHLNSKCDQEGAKNSYNMSTWFLDAPHSKLKYYVGLKRDGMSHDTFFLQKFHF